MRPSIAALLVCALFVPHADANVSKHPPASDQTAKAKKKAGGKAPKFVPGSAETTAERDRRLLRECKGRVNAGACAGYTG
ncbi:MAG: hypothetical protein JWQ88_3076 [Rhodoferax sp.]|nr:hypothetical protein [Rhodoferax sp.]